MVACEKMKKSSYLIYYLRIKFPNEFMVSIASLKSFSMEPDVHYIKYGPLDIETDDKAGCALQRGYLTIDKTLPWHVLRFLSKT